MGAARIAAVAVSCGLIAAGTANAVGEGRIVPQRGIAGLRLGMTQTQVKTTVGLPGRVERFTTELGPSTTFRYPTYSVTFFAGSRVTQLETRSSRERTAAGIGVGSTRAEVSRRVRGVSCLVEFGHDHCYVGAWQPGRTITDFSLERGHVNRVVIGYVID